MNKPLISFLIAWLWLTNAMAQPGTISVSGKVLEAGSGESLVGAFIVSAEMTKSLGTTTNQQGYFSLKIPKGASTLRISYVGFKTSELSVNLEKDTVLSIELSGAELNEVVIRESHRPDFIKGKLGIPIPLLKKIPMLFGEPDLMKALTYTPGVMVGQEGSSGLYVRGGSPEQNLLLLDEAPLYNSSHAFGFLSVFNPDAVKNIELYKGGFPARFGGRASSVVDITMKDGNYVKHTRELAVGLISSRVLAEGPLIKNKASYMIAARQMNTSLIFLPRYIKMWAGKPVDGFTSLWFYDVNAKLNYKPGKKDQIHLSLYTNRDYFINADQNSSGGRNSTALNWSNTTTSLRYNRIVSPQLFAKVTGFYSHFDYQMKNLNRVPVSEETILRNEYQLSNTIQDAGLKASLEYVPANQYTLRVGLENIWHRYHPGRVQVVDSSQPTLTINNASQRISAVESAVFVENDLEAGKYFTINAGMRLSRFEVEDKTYFGVEPRLSVGILLSQKHTLRIGLSRMNQYNHQLSSNGVGIPNDIWVPATQHVAPVSSQQIDLGWQWDLGGKSSWNVTLEVYRKKLANLIDYPQGANILSDLKANWEKLITTGGVGAMRGMEMMIQKKEGTLNGWIAYTFSKSERRFESINDGNWFPSRYDRRHTFSTVLNYKLSDRWSVSTNWMLQTGYPVTLPQAAGIDLSGFPTAIYVYRNAHRMPAYHRMDVAFTYGFLTARKHREAAWNFGVYNLYNRANPYYLEFQTLYKPSGMPPNGMPPNLVFDRNQITQKAVLPILPYVSYQIKF